MQIYIYFKCVIHLLLKEIQYVIRYGYDLIYIWRIFATQRAIIHAISKTIIEKYVNNMHVDLLKSYLSF